MIEQPEPDLSAEQEAMASRFAEQLDAVLDGILVNTYMVTGTDGRTFVTAVAFDARIGVVLTQAQIAEEVTVFDEGNIRSARDRAVTKACDSVKWLLA